MTYEEILQEILERVPSDVDKQEGSIIYDAVAPCAYALAQMYFQLENFLDLVLPDKAVEEYLDRAVAAYGMTRNPAVAAVRVMQTSNAVELGTRWGINELVYRVTDFGNKENEYLVTCETAGVIGNQYSGSMQPVSNVTGITAVLTEIKVAGSDEEKDDALRARFFQKVQQPATSGNAYHYRKWALEVSGVGDAKVFPLDQGAGTVTVLVVDADKRANEALEDTVYAYIESARPIGATVTVASPSEIAVNVTADILLDGSVGKEAVKEAFEEELEDYLRSLVFSDYRVSYAKIGSLLLATTGVRDYNDLRLNASTGNITVSEKSIPVAGTVDLTEVSELESI